MRQPQRGQYPAESWGPGCAILRSVPKGCGEAAVARRDVALADLPKLTMECHRLLWPDC